MPMWHLLTQPTQITLLRLIISPTVMPFLLVYLLPYQYLSINMFLAGLFLILGFTDFLDGYIARKTQQETTLGAVLDPLADKLLILSAVVSLLAAGKIYFYWTIIFIVRELIVMTIRLVAADHSINVGVTYHAKIKTAMQIIALAIIMINPYQDLGLWGAFWWNALEKLVLFTALVLTISSLIQYMQQFLLVLSKQRTNLFKI